MAIKIGASEYQTLRKWFAFVVDHVLPVSDIPADIHPVVVLDNMFTKTPGRARQGLAIAIGDVFEMTTDWSAERINELDLNLVESNLPTFSEIKFKFQGSIRRIVERGKIRSEREYYALRNVVEGIPNEFERDAVWQMLAEFEGGPVG